MKAAVHLPTPEAITIWIEALQNALPAWHFTPLEQSLDDPAIDYAIVWKPPTGTLQRLPNLKAIVSIGAGVDHILENDDVPTGLPLIRTVGEDLTQLMREYVALHVLRHHRDRPRQVADVSEKFWNPIEVPPATDRRVGVMGLGNLGRAAAQTLVALGFDTAGWARSPKQIDGVTCFAGEDAFPDFLARTEILVNLLPLTPDTAGILNHKSFAMLPKGACIINAARGPHLIEDDLLDAFNSGQIAQATLDVFTVEPLAPDHPFWTHPQVTVTPHIASRVDAPTGAKIIARNLQSFEETGRPLAEADVARGY